MIEFDIDIEIEKKLLVILKNKTKRFLKYLENNDIDIKDEEELIKAAKECEKEEKKNKKIYGINKILLLYTLAAISKNIDKKSGVKFRERIKPEMFEKTIEEADNKIQELYKNTTKRAIYYIKNYIENINKLQDEIFRKSVELSTDELKKQIKSLYSESIKKMPENIDKYIERLRSDKSKFKLEEFEKMIKDDIVEVVWQEARNVVNERMKNSDILNINSVLGEIQAEYTKIIMKELGINTFIWVTKHDDRVREKHAWREGKVFNMNGKLVKGSGEDTAEILPKQEWGCRCKMGIEEKTIEEAVESA